MITTAKERAYVAAVLDSFLEQSTIPTDVRENALIWLTTKDENVATDLLPHLKKAQYSSSQFRYRFSSDSKNEEVIKIIFEAAFKNSDRLINKAEDAAGTSNYPISKKIYQIQIPRFISSVFENLWIKVFISSLSVLKAYESLPDIYHDAQTLITDNRVVSLLTENAPIPLIHLFDQTVSSLKPFYTLQSLLLAALIKEMILMGPKIPYLTSGLRAIKFGDIVYSSMTAPVSFAICFGQTVIDTGRFVWNKFNEVGQFFKNIAEKAEVERLGISKRFAYEKWVEVLKKM